MNTRDMARARADTKFNERERRHLLSSPGLGPIVVERLEQSGIASIAALQTLGVDAVVDAMCQPGQNMAWFNRRRALLRAVNRYGQTAPA